MKILITGASGFLGGWFLGYFLNTDGNDVWAVDTEPQPNGLPLDQDDLETWLADFDEDVDVAFHFASPVGGRMKIELDPLYNVDAFRLDSVFFRWAAKHARLLVYPSSSAVYPTMLQGAQSYTPLTESMVSFNVDLLGQPDELYGMSKLTGEYIAWKVAQKYGVNTLCIRPFSGYGPGQSHDYPVTAIAQRAVNREDPIVVWGGSQRRDFIYASDIVGATLARIAAGVDGYQVMNICSGQPVSFRSVADLCAQVVGYRPAYGFEGDRPIGVMTRYGDPVLMRGFYEPTVSLRQGLEHTIEALSRPIEKIGPLTLGAAIGG